MRFQFNSYEISPSPIDGSTELYRPEIPLHLIGESAELFLFGLLDTGADGVVIGKELAKSLGVKIDACIEWPLRGFSNHVLHAVLGHLEIEVMDSQESVTWSMPVGVVDFGDPLQEDIILLGQTGFLQFFDVRFFGSEHAVELIPNASFPRKSR